MVHEHERNVRGNPYTVNEDIWAPTETPPYIYNGGVLGLPVYDTDSIMIYPYRSCSFKKKYQTCEFVNTKWNNKLSDGDKLTLRMMYPRRIKTNDDRNLNHVENYLYKSKNNIFMYSSIFFILIIVLFIIIIIIKCKCINKKNYYNVNKS
jgi:hypothetical protein